MQKHKYPGKLGRPISAKDKKFLEAAKSGNLEEWIAEERARRLMLLCKHYRIPTSNPPRLSQLCIELAFNHVPGFSIDAPEPRRKRGRPPISRAGWPRLIDHVKAVHHLSGYGSDKKALDLVLRGMMPEPGVSLPTLDERRHYKKVLRSFEKILSNARHPNSQKIVK